MTKQHILDEIKRVALANGGSTPGMDSFHNETGITYYDWFGKYWPRWSEAVLEAGLTPNQMNVSYGEKVLVEKLIDLTRELGHFPVKGELRQKAFNDRKFPSDKAFQRLGTKSELIAKVAEYCRREACFLDVLRICEEASPKIKKNKVLVEELELSEKIGIVYLIKSGKFYKIGKTNSIGRREYDIALQLAEKPTTVHVIKTDDPDGIEAYWHRRFAAKRKNGEWFDLKASDVKAFKKWLRIV